jgi:tetratricopeptide (TPR) repeat protein
MNHPLNQSSCLSAGELQRYHAGNADNALRFRVENHLLDCPLCAAALEGYAGAGNPGPTQIAAELEALQAEVEERAGETPVRKLSWFNRAAAAAVFIGLCAAGWLYWNHTGDERLYAGFFEAAESDNLTLRSEGDQAAAPELRLAMQLYGTGKYEDALPYYRAYLTENPEDFQAALYGGIAALEGGQNAQAVSWLESTRFNDPERYAEATWYLALAQLRNGNRSECKSLLEELAGGKNAEWAEKAGALLGRLDGGEG